MTEFTGEIHEYAARWPMRTADELEAAVDALLREAAKPLNADRARRTQNPSRNDTRRLVAVPPLPVQTEVDGQDGGAT